MNPLKSPGATTLVFRLFFVFAAVGVLCHIDSVLDAYSVPDEVEPDITQVRYTLPDDHRAATLSEFIQTRFKAPDHVAQAAAQTALQSSRETGLPASLILAVAAVESGFDPLSDNGHDKGLMQINPKWHPAKVAKIGGVSGLFDVKLGMKTGALILKEYKDASHSNIVAALMKYNGAVTSHVYPDKVLAEKKRFDDALAMNTHRFRKHRCEGVREACYPSRVPT